MHASSGAFKTYDCGYVGKEAIGLQTEVVRAIRFDTLSRESKAIACVFAVFLEAPSAHDGCWVGESICIIEVLGLPPDVETEELKYYMRTYGEVDDCVVMKDRITRQSRGFGYVTFSTAEEARKAVSSQHTLNGRALDVKIATPKDEMVPSASRKVSRIFVARIPPHVTETMFRSYFQTYGEIVDAYMPKDLGSRSHRGIGFVTFDSAEAVDRIMNQTHELGGTLVAVDRATPKEETLKGAAGRPRYDPSVGHFSEEWAKALPDQWGKMTPEQFGFYMAAAAAMAQMGSLGGMGGAPEGFDFESYGYPGFMASGMGADNASGAAVKNDNTNVNDLQSGGSEAPKVPSSSSSGYATQSGAPQSTAVAASGYDPDGAAQNNPGSAYGAAAFFNNMYTMFSGYGANPAASNPPAAAYNNPPHGAAPGGTNYAVGYGQQTAAPGYYNTSTGDATIQPYGFDQGSGVFAAGAYPYGGPAVPGQGYDNNVSYPSSEASNYGYAVPTAGPIYTSNISYDQTAIRSGANNSQTLGNKVFVGKLPYEATAEHLRNYFSAFGTITDVYIPKDPNKPGHRGFGFVTFHDDGAAERVALQSHEILGQPVAIDRPTPQASRASNAYPGGVAAQMGSGDMAASGNPAELQQNYDYAAGNLGFFAGAHQPNPYDGAPGVERVSRPSDVRYRPY